jgi:HAD superfamily hydrolase (TIGR01450 family)
MAAFIDTFDGFLFDLDGVLYAGPQAIPGAVEAVQALVEAGRAVGFVTNNASRSEEAVAEHLQDLGVPATKDNVFGSARTGLSLLSSTVPAGAAVYVAGSAYLSGIIADAGFTALSLEDMENGAHADAVIQGFDPSLGWRHLAAASYAIGGGAVWVATNMDSTIPRAEGIAPGNGSLVQAVMTATRKTPAVAGKPEPQIFHDAAARLGLSRPIMVGDRLDTDILGGNRAGFATALVLTGIDSRESAAAAPETMQPVYAIDTLESLVSNADLSAAEFKASR